MVILLILMEYMVRYARQKNCRVVGRICCPVRIMANIVKTWIRVATEACYCYCCYYYLLQSCAARDGA